MRITLLTDTFLPQINGIVTATIGLAKGLAYRGHQILVVAPYYRGVKEFSHPNVTVVRIKGIPVGVYEDFKLCNPFSSKAEKAILRHKTQVLHFQTPMMLGFLAARLAKKHKIPLVSTFHTFFAHPRYLKHIRLNYKWMERIAWSYAGWFNEKCKIVTCPSEMAKQELIKHDTKTMFKAISNGIDVSYFDNTHAKEMKKKYNPKGKILLSVGRIAHEKNILFLLDCFDEIRKQVKGTKLILVGDGPQRDEVKAYLKKKNLSEEVILTGSIPHDIFVRSGIYGASDIFVTASDTETQGLGVLEAQANGLVCVGVNGGAVPELISHKKNGYLVTPGDKKAFVSSTVDLLTNKKHYDEYRKATLKDVKKHDVKHILAEWERLYASVISSQKK